MYILDVLLLYRRWSVCSLWSYDSETCGLVRR